MSRRRFTYDPERRLASAVILRALQELAATYAEEARAKQGLPYGKRRVVRPLWRIHMDRRDILADLHVSPCLEFLAMAGVDEECLERALARATQGDPHVFAVNTE